jgi:hypothetical protein
MPPLDMLSDPTTSVVLLEAQVELFLTFEALGQ